MHWWDELWQQWEEDPSGLPYALVALAAGVALSLLPLILIAFGLSFIVPIGRWFAVPLVLVVWPVQWRVVVALGSLDFRWAAALIIGEFVLASLLGPVPSLVVIVMASVIAYWVIGRMEARNQAAFAAAWPELLDDDVSPRRRPPHQ